MSGPLSDVTANHVSFYLKNRDCFEGAESAATIAILRPYASLTYNNAMSSYALSWPSRR